MKTILHSIVLAIGVLCGQSIIAQNNILFKINHHLGSDDFALFQEAESPDGQAFELDRLEYYISEISVTHDGGSVTTFDSLWILVDASTSTNEFLGEADIDSVEAISFSIGVDEAHNHLDPSSWPSGHPLFHQSPSMHWGWTAGYRFVALEGVTAGVSNQVFEVHALGDNNYFETTVSLETGVSYGNVTIEIFADYAKSLSNVDISSGVISHGGTGESITVLQNFRDLVFTSELIADTTDTLPDTPEGIAEIRVSDRFSVYPNPAWGNEVVVRSIEPANNGILECLDLQGRLVSSTPLIADATRTFSGLEGGVYIIRYTEYSSGVVQLERVIVR